MHAKGSHAGVALLCSIALTASGTSDAQELMWTDWSAGVIQRTSLDTTYVEVFAVANPAKPRGIAVDAASGCVYWSEMSRAADGTPTGRIRRTAPGRRKPVTLVEFPRQEPAAVAIDADGGKIYWSLIHGEARIQRSNLDGSEVEDVITSGLRSPRGIALDPAAGKIYWADAEANRIQRANLDGSQVEAVITVEDTDILSPIAVALDPSANALYWTDWTGGTLPLGRVRRAALDGSDIETVISSEHTMTPPTLVLDLAAGNMYWAEAATVGLPFNGTIWQADLDGEYAERLFDRVRSPAGIALGDGVAISTMLGLPPDSCPGKIDGRRGGFTMLVIAGKPDLDVTQIDRDSIVLRRADGLGEMLTPIVGPLARRRDVRDVLGYANGESCRCRKLEGDGWGDLMIRFSARRLTRLLDLGSRPRPMTASHVLVLEATLLDGRRVVASGCVKALGPGKLLRPPQN